MSDEIENYKNQLKAVGPLLKSKRYRLNMLKKKLDDKNTEFNKYKHIYDEKYNKKQDLLMKIDAISSSDEFLDVNILNNARHYLVEVNDDLIVASSSLKTREQAADKAKNNFIECHVNIKVMEKYEENKTHEYKQVLEKIQAREIEDLWLQSKAHKADFQENFNERN